MAWGGSNMYLDGLDGLDQKIVQLLIENARISYSDIADKVGLSRVAVKARIQALEQKGIIEEYTTVINPRKISGAVSCYFDRGNARLPAGGHGAPAPERYRHADLPRHRKRQAPCPCRGRLLRRDGGISAHGH